MKRLAIIAALLAAICVSVIPAAGQLPATNQLLAKMLWGYPNFKVHEFKYSDSAVSDTLLTFPWLARAFIFTSTAYCSVKVYGAAYTDSTGLFVAYAGLDTITVNAETGIDTTWQRVKANEVFTIPVQTYAVRIGYPADGLCRLKGFRD